MANKSYEKLDELNSLLSNTELNIPHIRRTVDTSGRNLPWLVKHIESRNVISDRLRELVNLPIQELVK